MKSSEATTTTKTKAVRKTKTSERQKTSIIYKYSTKEDANDTEKAYRNLWYHRR